MMNSILLSKPEIERHPPERIHSFEWPRIVASVLIVLAVVAIAESMRQERAEIGRSELSTEGRFLLSLEDTHTGLMEVKGATNEIASASPAACEILGYKPGELSGKSINAILPMPFQELHQQRLRDTISKASDGKNHFVSTMHCIALDKGGSPVEIVVRVFVSRNGIIALLNRFEDVRYIPMPGEKPPS